MKFYLTSSLVAARAFAVANAAEADDAKRSWSGELPTFMDLAMDVLNPISLLQGRTL